MDARLPTHLEAAGIRRIAESQGGFAMVLKKGEPDAGTIALVIKCRDLPIELFERMPQADGNRIFISTLRQDTENEEYFFDILERRSRRDPDLWLIEAEVPNLERFVAALPG